MDSDGKAEAEARVQPGNTPPPDSDNPTVPPPLLTCMAVPVVEVDIGRGQEPGAVPYLWKHMVMEM